MAKGYWIVSIDVQDMDGFAAYGKVVRPLLVKWNGVFVVRAGSQTIVEGSSRGRNVVIEFPSYQAALDCYRSQEYQDIVHLRADATDTDLVIIEGLDAN